PGARSLAATARLLMGMVAAGADMTLHSAAPATRLIARAFTGHLPIVSARPVTSPTNPEPAWTISRTATGWRSRSVEDTIRRDAQPISKRAFGKPAVWRME